MEENIIVMNDEELVPVEREESVDDVSSGNGFSKGVAAVAAAGVLALGVVIGRTIKKHKDKKAAVADGDKPAADEKPKPEKKGLRISKNKQIIIIDKRDQKKEEVPAEENDEE